MEKLVHLNLKLNGHGKFVFSCAAGLASVAMIGYCIYFDRKRRSAPDFHKKLRERRRRNRRLMNAQDRDPFMNRILLGDVHDFEARKRYSMQEMQNAEQHLAKGNYDRGAEHFARAIIVCNCPVHFLQILRNALTADIYNLIIMKLQELQIKQKQLGKDKANNGKNHSNGNTFTIHAQGHCPKISVPTKFIDINDLE